MERKEVNVPQRPEKKPKTRFQIVKLERRIAPGNLLHVNGHVHIKVK
ncbi:MAG: hypothetical protein HYS12_02620 [Planctomycetes bacterium]|nr:hypothetical protein [Planctomycetota bacterium]